MKAPTRSDAVRGAALSLGSACAWGPNTRESRWRFLVSESGVRLAMRVPEASGVFSWTMYRQRKRRSEGMRRSHSMKGSLW